MAYIYQIENDINGKIYVGKTEFSIEKRFQEHCNDAHKRKYEQRPLYAAMRKYGVEHFHISLLEETDNPEERECFWIEQKQSFKNGYNATMGGEGRRYLDYDLICATYYQLQNMSETAKKCNCSVDSVKNILIERQIKINSQATIEANNRQKKIIHQFSKEGIYIKTFSGIREAARWLIENNYAKSSKEVGVASHIRDVANGKRKTAYGFMWKFT